MTNNTPVIEVGNKFNTCRRCGKTYSSLKENFTISSGALYKGAGYLSICNDCISDVYSTYLRECGDRRMALIQLCRALNVYWSEPIYDAVVSGNPQIRIELAYLRRVNKGNVNKCFDDTLREAGIFWSKGMWNAINGDESEAEEEQTYHITKAIRNRFGPGYTDQMYDALQTRYEFWLKQLPPDVDKNDAGTQALLIQLCGAELDAANQRTSGQSADRSVKTINDVIASLGLRPASKKDDELNAALEKVPLGVWLKRYEEERPLPELDEPLKDNKIKRYIMTWCVGHLAKMLGLKNEYTKMYDDAIEQLRVERPSFEGDDEDLIIESFGEEDYSSVGEEEEPSDDTI